MKEPDEERLANIESSITRLANMQSCVYSLLRLVYSRSCLSDSIERKMASVEWHLVWHRIESDTALALFMGGIGAVGVAVGLLAVSAVTQGLAVRVAWIVASLLAIVLLAFAASRWSHGRGYLRDAERSCTEPDDYWEIRKKEAAALDQALTQIKTDWERLNTIPDEAGRQPDDEASYSRSRHAEGTQ